MAIIGGLPGVEVYIVANGQRLREYDACPFSQNQRSSTSADYIELKSGQAFEMLWILRPGLQFFGNAIQVAVYIDGERVRGGDIRREVLGDLAVFHREAGLRIPEPDEEALDARRSVIRVEMWHVDIVPEDDSESTLKTRSHLVDAPRPLIKAVEFRYRARAALERLGVIERSPDPFASLRNRDSATPGLEDTLGLLRRGRTSREQRASQEQPEGSIGEEQDASQYQLGDEVPDEGRDNQTEDVKFEDESTRGQEGSEIKQETIKKRGASPIKDEEVEDGEISSSDSATLVPKKRARSSSEPSDSTQ